MELLPIQPGLSAHARSRVSNYITWEGKCFEGAGVEPNVEVPSLSRSRARTELQLEEAKIAASL
jgi:C-terminal processing protease CtpA/Prc